MNTVNIVEKLINMDYFVFPNVRKLYTVKRLFLSKDSQRFETTNEKPFNLRDTICHLFLKVIV